MVIGGHNAKYEPTFPPHLIWEYNCYTEHWSACMILEGETAPLELADSSATAIGADIYVFGGLRVRKNCTWRRTNDMWKLSKSTQEHFICRKIEFHGNEKLPSPRSGHSSWENRTCLWVFGGIGDSSTGYLHDYGEFLAYGVNNQLLRFDPWDKTWTNPKCFGTIPSPRYGHSTAVIRDNVWLFGGNKGKRLFFNDLFQFDTYTCAWTQIRTAGIEPQECSNFSFTAVSDTQLILHGGDRMAPWQSFNATWIFDLTSQTWRTHKSPMALPRTDHTGSQSVSKSVIIIGGLTDYEAYQSYTSTFHVTLEPKSLQQLAMKTIYSYQTWLSWKHLPKKLIARLGLATAKASNKEV